MTSVGSPMETSLPPYYDRLSGDEAVDLDSPDEVHSDIAPTEERRSVVDEGTILSVGTGILLLATGAALQYKRHSQR